MSLSLAAAPWIKKGTLNKFLRTESICLVQRLAVRIVSKNESATCHVVATVLHDVYLLYLCIMAVKLHLK